MKKIKPLWFTLEKRKVIITTDEGDVVLGERDQWAILSMLFKANKKHFRIYAEMLKAARP